MNGVTVDIASGSAAITQMNFGGSTTADDIEVGHYINIAGVSGTKTILTYNESAETATVNIVSDATVDDAAMSWQGFTFINGPDYGAQP